MSTSIPINERMFWIGVNDHDTGLFEELWPMPNGISYNSYLIKDDRVAIVEAVKSFYAVDYLDTLKALLGDKRKIDYLIVNHVEPDHSGAIKVLLEAFPGLQIIGNQKTAGLLADFYSITENVRAVGDGDELDLGRCKLTFFLTPMVHWPETMMTYESTHHILFSGDVFGGFAAVDDGLFDDEISDIHFYEDETLRYFTNVIGKYSTMVQKALSKISSLDIGIVAPAHGPVWRKDPRRIVRLYDRWSRNETDEGVTIVYASMYGNTEKMMEAVARALAEEHVGSIATHNLSRTHISYIIADAWRHRALILGTPTYNMMPFPLMEHFIRVMENKGLKDRLLGIFGSYGWAGGALKELKDFGERMKWQLIEPVVETRGAPKAETLTACEQLGRNIAVRLKQSVPA
ncbi:MAG: FprA family A-type flavoprotein [Nitrospirota bacterium]